MEQQVDIDILDVGSPDTPAVARWLICDNGMTVDEGTVRYNPQNGMLDWNGSPPPISLYTTVVLQLDRALARRIGRNSGQ